MENYVGAELEVVATVAADVITASVTYDRDETKEDKFDFANV